MQFRGLAGAFFALAASAAASLPTAQQLANDLQNISLDPAHTYRVRELSLARGDIKLYLTEGTLSFFTPVDKRTIAALFTVEGTEAGDAELILMPPRRSERASLASYTKTPNLDEHFSSALFFFTDNTAAEVLEKLNRGSMQEIPDEAAALAARADPVGRQVAKQIEIALLEALLDKHKAEDGLFYAVLGTQTLGAIDVTYDPTQEESVFVGRATEGADSRFELWTNFRPRHAAPFVQPATRIHDYQLDSKIHDDLSMDVSARFEIETDADDGRVLPLMLSPRLHVDSAEIDGVPAEIFQRPKQRLAEMGSAETLLLAAAADLATGKHQVELRYSGTVIRRVESGEYFVDDRNTWYPVDGAVSAMFDMTFHCPEHLHLVATGEAESEAVENGVRTVHRKTARPVALAGFNLGEYDIRREHHNAYEIEVDAPRLRGGPLVEDPTLGAQTGSILNAYSKRWQPLAQTELAVTPIAGYFGQGFPGLIYLSSVSFIKERDRSAALRGPRFDAFFTELLLPHEIAHQWWGSIVRQADYRSAWIAEAMANLSALDYIEQTRGAGARNDIFDSYREDLLREKDGKRVESAGPVDFGERLLDTYDLATWHVVLYEKGSWILQMLRRRLGDENFRQLQLALLRDFAAKPISNEDLRKEAAAFVPAGEPDRELTNFFDTWVYGTGIPELALRSGEGRGWNLEVSGVPDDFLAEVPLRCKGGATFWVRAGAGANEVELPAGAGCELPSKNDFLFVAGR